MRHDDRRTKDSQRYAAAHAQERPIPVTPMGEARG